MWTTSSDASDFVSADRETYGPSDEPALVCAEAAFDQAFHYWRGASGRRYLHSVYSLVGCPALPQANFILVRRHEDGSREALSFGNTKADAMSLNLARLRHEGAKIGANEVHIHLLADTAQARTFVEADLTAAQLERPATSEAA
ncbi:MAG: hypothetical protein QNJ62_06950 [Methyloceanibacter sp.]|nr:hypothetical protein [Methyloceanibacter sp.]